MVDILLPLTCILGVLAILLVAVLTTGKNTEGDMPTPQENDTPPTLHSDLVATSRMLRRLLDHGALDAETHHRLMAMLREEHQRTTATAPVTVSAEVVEAEAVTPVSAAPAVSVGAEDGIQYVDTRRNERAEAPVASTVRPPVTPAAAAMPSRVAASMSESAKPAEPPAPPRPLSDLLRGFMEEKNIRWGELVAGVLIVGCSIGLVVALRETLSVIPYFPALLFMLVSAAIHGVGNYTLRRWNLTSSSRVLLIIGMLLIPLSFLAGIVLTGQGESQRPVTDWRFLTAVAVGVTAFGAMAYFSSRALSPRGWLRLALAVMLPSTAQLFINRLAAPEMGQLPLMALAAVPVAGFLIPLGAQLYRASAWRRLSPQRANDIYLLLGAAAFSLVAALALLFWKAWDMDAPARRFEQLSPLLSLTSAAVLAVGLAIARLATARRMNVARVVGVALALLGGLTMVGWVAVAWPTPSLLIAVGLVNAAVLFTLAGAGRLQVLHCPAVACLALACLLGFHEAAGTYGPEGVLDSRQLVVALLMGRSAWVLIAVAAAVGGAAAAVFRKGHRDDAQWLGYGAAGAATVSVLITLYTGFAFYTTHLRIGPIFDGDLAAPLLLLYAVAAFAVGSRLRFAYATSAGAVLLWLSLAQTLAFNHTALTLLGELAPVRGVLTASIVLAVLCAAGAVVFDQRLQADEPDGRRRTPLFRGVVAPLTLWALVSSIAAAPFLVLFVGDLYAMHAVYAGCIAVVWLTLSVNFRWWQLFWAFQAVTVVAIWYALLAIGLAGGWYNGQAIDLAYLPMQITVLALWCGMWSVLRRCTESLEVTRALSPDDVPSCDQMLLGVLVLAPLATAAYGCLPGVLLELGFVESLEQLPWDMNISATHGPSAWMALLAVLAALAAALWERCTALLLVGLAIVTAATALLTAGTFESSDSVASATRWGFALWGVAATALLCARNPIKRFLTAQSWLRGVDSFDGVSPWFRGLTLGISGAPLLAITLIAADRQLVGLTVGEPAAGSLFDRMGPMLSYPLPLAMYVGMLVAFALREQQAGYMLGGSLVLQGTVNLLYALHVSVALVGVISGAQYAVELLQCNAVCVAVYGLLWLAVRRRLGDASADATCRNVAWPPASPLLTAQLAAAFLLTIVLGLLSCRAVLLTALNTSESLLYLGRWPSYAAWGLTLAAGLWLLRHNLHRHAIHLFSTAGLVLSALIAASIAARLGHRWFGMHLLSGGWLLVAAGGVAAAFCTGGQAWRHRLRSRTDALNALLHICSLSWASVIGLVLVGVAMLYGYQDLTPWWPGASTACVALLAGAAALRPTREGYRYAATLLGCLAMCLFQVRSTFPFDPPFVYLAPVLLVALCSALVWLAIDLYLDLIRRRGEAASPAEGERDAPHQPRLRVYHLAAIAVTGLMMLVVGGGALLGWAIPNPPFDISEPLGLTTLLLLATLLVAMLWQRRAPLSPLLLLVWCVIALTMAIDQHAQTPVLEVLRTDDQLLQRFTMMAWALGLAVLAALVAQVWRRRRSLAWLGEQLGIPEAKTRLESLRTLLVVGVSAYAAIAVLLEFMVVLTYPGDERWLRVSASFAPALAALGFAALTDRGRPSRLRLTTMLALTCAAVLISWSDMRPVVDGTQEVLHLSVRLLVVLSGLSLAYVGLARWLSSNNDWYESVWRTAVGCSLVGIAVLVGVLSQEAAFFRATPPVLATPEIAMVAIVLVGLAAALLLLALSRAADPLSLSDDARQVYVYAAQAVAALLFAHLFLCRPEWFSGVLREYWPLVAMGIAFAGVGLGELFHRLRIRVLAEPFSRTGLLLPLLPALGMWVVGAEQTSRPLLLLVVGLLYALVAMSRRSMVSGLAAGLAGNAALLVLMHEQQFELVENPQWWLIPPAVSVLVAAQLNRHRLSEEQLTGIRYAAMLVIYISSTSEILFVRSGTALWPPMVLTLLAVLGVLAGIALQIRAFLYLGTTFVLVSVITMVHHAARGINETWPWWAFGICVGLVMLLMRLALEMKRPQILAFLEQLKQWEK